MSTRPRSIHVIVVDGEPFWAYAIESDAQAFIDHNGSYLDGKKVEVKNVAFTEHAAWGLAP